MSNRIENAISSIDMAISDLEDVRRDLERDERDDNDAEWLASKYTIEQLREAIEIIERRPTLPAIHYLTKHKKRGGNIRDYWTRAKGG